MSTIRAKFASVEQLLVSVSEGLGSGNAALSDLSRTPYGTALAMKSAQVTVDFVLASELSGTGIGPVSVGANTLFGIGTTTTKELNHATILMQIVPIEMTEAAKPLAAEGTKPPTPIDEKTLIGLVDTIQTLTHQGKLSELRAILANLARTTGSRKQP